jgi:hypothetical protein
MREIAVAPEGTRFTLIGPQSAETTLKFLQQITIAPAENLAANIEGALTFRGYCGKDAMADVTGKIVVCFGTQREGLPSGSVRAANARAGGALGLINVDDPYSPLSRRAGLMLTRAASHCACRKARRLLLRLCSACA